MNLPQPLTQHQLHIALLVADGLANKEIARRIGLKEHTIATELKPIFRKLGVTNRVQCAVTITRAQLERHNPPPSDQPPLWHTIIHQETTSLKAHNTTTSCAHAALDTAALLADVLAGLVHRLETLESKARS
jgi:DNA-binding CsgD family transcriptional regulator